MRIKSGYILREIAGSYFAVPLDDNENKMITMNESSADIWRLLEGGTDYDTLVKEMCGLYDADEETIKEDISGFLDKLTAAGILES